MIGDATFDYSVHGDILALTPIITARQRREALRRPLGVLDSGMDGGRIVSGDEVESGGLSGLVLVRSPHLPTACPWRGEVS
jgi:hypothetical protein